MSTDDCVLDLWAFALFYFGFFFAVHLVGFSALFGLVSFMLFTQFNKLISWSILACMQGTTKS